jgi:hypothetical protein
MGEAVAGFDALGALPGVLAGTAAAEVTRLELR